MSFLTELRTASVALHTRGQLARRVPARAPTAAGLSRFLMESREAHVVFRTKFPVRTSVDFAAKLSEDIRAMYGLDMSDYPSEYADYLGTLTVPQLGCHWYNMVFAHLAGGGSAVYGSIRGALDRPLLYYESIGEEDMVALRAAFEHETDSWTEEDRRACLEETRRAFGFGLDLMEMMTE
jgi:hypothetical protein